MLGRTAEDLFWLSRYIERAENMARIVEVAYRIGLMPQQGEGRYEEWRSALISTGCESGYLEKYEEVRADRVIDYLLFESANPSSVQSCLDAARRNGRAQRTALTHDMWESLNTTWIEFGALGRQRRASSELLESVAWIKQRSALFRGALSGTSLRNDTWNFSRLGAFVERADNTARILDVKYFVLLPVPEQSDAATHERQWSAILRSASALRSYHWVYRDAVKPWRVAELLILNGQVPRSLAFSYERLVATLGEISGEYGVRHPAGAAARATADLLVQRSISDIFQEGLHEFLLDFRDRNARLARQIGRDFHFQS